ncbi:MAG: RusA family crossover junction endodeoxyribonuclease [Candidatus Omnitrophota bacterium]
MKIEYFVPGVPKPGGSKKGFYNKHLNRVMIVDACAGNKTWRDSVKFATLEAYSGPQLNGPLSLSVTFKMPRPQGHFCTGKNAGVLKHNAPYWHTKRPDRTKLLRSTEDAIKDSGIVVDDTIFCDGNIRKVYSNDGRCGALIVIEGMVTTRSGEKRSLTGL